MIMYMFEELLRKQRYYTVSNLSPKKIKVFSKYSLGEYNRACYRQPVGPFDAVRLRGCYFCIYEHSLICVFVSGAVVNLLTVLQREPVSPGAVVAFSRVSRGRKWEVE
jgi:hypothetical protein